MLQLEVFGQSVLNGVVMHGVEFMGSERVAVECTVEQQQTDVLKTSVSDLQ